jgi:hypothetical protein
MPYLSRLLIQNMEDSIVSQIIGGCDSCWIDKSCVTIDGNIQLLSSGGLQDHTILENGKVSEEIWHKVIFQRGWYICLWSILGKSGGIVEGKLGIGDKKRYVRLGYDGFNELAQSKIKFLYVYKEKPAMENKIKDVRPIIGSSALFKKPTAENIPIYC